MFSRGFICKIVVQVIEKFQLIASFFDDQCKTEYENENRTNDYCIFLVYSGPSYTITSTWSIRQRKVIRLTLNNVRQ